MPKKALFDQLVNALKIKNPESKRIRALLSRLSKEKFDFEKKDSSGYTLLILAAKFGNIQVVNTLISAQASLDTTDNFGNTALMWAVIKEHTDCVYSLIKAGATLELQRLISNQTALDFAVNRQNISATNLLLSHGAMIREPKKLYAFLKNVEGLKALPSLVFLYKQQKHSFDMSGEYKELNENQFKHLEKILRFIELHHANIYRSIDEGTRHAMPDVLLNLITQYNSPEENSIKGLKNQHLSFFSHHIRLNLALEREKIVETELLYPVQKMMPNKRSHESDDDRPHKKNAR